MKDLSKYFFLSLALTISAGVQAQHSGLSVIEAQYLSPIESVMTEKTKADSITILFDKAVQAALEKELYQPFFGISLPYIQKIYDSGYEDVADQLLEKYIKFTESEFSEERNLLANLWQERAWEKYFLNDILLADRYVQEAINNRTIAKASHSSDGAGDLSLAANIAAALDRPLEAEQYFSEALSIYQQEEGAGSHKLASTHSNFGIFYQSRRQYNQQIEHQEQALSIFQQLYGPNYPMNIELLIALSFAHYNKGDFTRSLTLAQRALDILETDNTPSINLGKAYYNIGLNHTKTGNYFIAEGFLLKALAIFEELKDQDQYLAIIYQALANLKAEQGDFKTAFQNRQKVLLLYTELYGTNDPDVARSLENLSVDFLDLGQLDSSLFYITKSIAILEATEDEEWELATAYNSLADVYLAKSDWTRAKQATEQALRLQKQIEQRHANTAYSYNALSGIELRDNPERALQFAHQAVQANHRSLVDTLEYSHTPTEGYFKYDYYFESILHKAAAFRALGKDQEALGQYKTADQVLDGVKFRINSRKDKVNLADAVYRLSKAAISHTAAMVKKNDRQEYWNQAFYFSEKSKANVLLQSITGNRAKSFGNIPDSLIAREEALQTDINYYTLALASEPDSMQVLLYRAQLFDAQRDQTALIKQFETDYPAYYELKYQNTIPEISAIQPTISPAQAIISYFTADNTLYIFYLDRDQFLAHQSAVEPDFIKRVQQFRDGIALQLPEEYFDQAQRLYQVLFPFAIPDGINQLVLIPDGALTQIPFEALLTEATSSTEDFNNLPYLLRRYTISYAPSAALFYQLNQEKQKDEQSAAGLLAYAPVFTEPEEVSSMALDFFSKLEEAEQRAYGKDGEYIQPLPGTAKELEAISEVFSRQDIPIKTYTHDEAKEAQIKQADTRNYRYLHIATHGFVNENNPDLSGLLFYPDTSSTEDGILASGEVYSLKLNADLVVLSACETGMGKITYGEGILGLSQAFLYAGAKDLMVSLWKVDDQATARMMTGFYETHLQDKAFHDALRQAKLELIDHSDYAHPYYWSAFLLMGK